jgi:hypothetical protein
MSGSQTYSEMRSSLRRIPKMKGTLLCGATVFALVPIVTHAQTHKMNPNTLHQQGATSDVIPTQTNAVQTTASAATLIANSTTPGASIPTDFVGFSYEYSEFAQSTRAPFNTMPSLIAVTEALGSNVSIRVGGASVDTATVVNPSNQEQGLISFIKAVATSSPLIEGLNYTQNNPALDTADATTFSAKLGSQVVYQIGNEPDLYRISEATYQAQWSTLRGDVINAVPGAVFWGPDAASGTSFAVPFAAGVGSQISGFTHHLYGEGTTHGTASDIVRAWQKNTIDSLARDYPTIMPAAGYSGIPTRMTESGGLNGSGNSVVANSLGAAAWCRGEQLCTPG